MSSDGDDATRARVGSILPIPVAVLTFGHAVHGAAVQRAWIEEDVTISDTSIDLREAMPDPHVAFGVNYAEDGAVPKTILSVFNQESFRPSVMKVVRNVFACGEELVYNDDMTGVFAKVGCNKGCHRSNVLGRAVKEYLNFFVNKDGVRVFNAQTFHMFGAKGRECGPLISRARSWAASPWALIEAPSVKAYGHDVVVQSRESQYNYDAMWDAMVAIGRGEDMVVGDSVLLMSTRVDTPSEQTAAVAEADDELGGEGPVERPKPSSSGPSAPSTGPTPRPPTTPPPQKCRKTGAAPTAAPTVKAPTQAGPPCRAPIVVPPLYPSPRAPAATVRLEVAAQAVSVANVVV